MKLLFLVAEDWYFVSHRLQLACAARDAGAKVLLMTHLTEFRTKLEKEGFRVIPWRIARRSLNPLRELRAFLQVVKTYKRERPDLLHHVALKPIVYGGLAAQLYGGMASVNAISGVGHVFTSCDWKMRILRRGLLRLLRLALVDENARAVFQNEENRMLFISEGVVPPSRTAVIRGPGVDINRFVPHSEPDGPPVVLLAARMLWDKGVGEFVEAARLLRTQGSNARFVLVGKPDPENPSSIPEMQIRAWAGSRLVEWWGHQDDMTKIFAQANIVCLPSYGEGMPRVLIEAASCGRAIVTTDVPGCRDIVRHGENGLLVPAHDAKALASTLVFLLKNDALRAAMGARGREIAVREFSEEGLNGQILAVYHELLKIRSDVPLLHVPDQESSA